MKKYNWAIIAPGRMATKFATALKNTNNAVLYAVASRSLERAQAFADSMGFQKAYGSYQEMVEDPNVDVVYIASPHTFHKEHTLMCLKNGKHVLCEKVFALDSSEVAEMVQEAQRQHLFLMEALWSLFQPHYAKAKEILASGKLGKIVQLNGRFSYMPPPERFATKCDLSIGACSLHDIGIYPVIDALTFIGIPDTIFATAEWSPTGSEKTLNALFKYKSGEVATIYSSYCTNNGIGCDILCENGNMSVFRDRDMNQKVILNIFGETEQIFEYKPATMGYHWEAEEVMRCIENDATESEIVPLSFSTQLISVLDRIRSAAGITFPIK